MNSTFMRIFVFLSLAILPGICQAKKKPAQSFPKVTIPGSELRTLKSTSTGRHYDLYIHIPPHYDQEVGQKYPVLYLLDGQWDFKLLDSVLGGLVYDKFVPDMIIVGITYSGANPNYNALRAMDYTPTATANVKGSGGGPNFLAFLKTELIPFIESHYRADSDRRVLMGSSYGGLFTLYAMLSQPDLCWAYVAASPAVTYDDGFFLKQEAEYAQAHKDLPVKLFLAVGELEDLSTSVKDLMKTISSRNYKGLKLETRVIEGERHAGNKPETFNRGLRFVFNGEYPLPPDHALLDQSLQFLDHEKYPPGAYHVANTHQYLA